MTKLKTGTEANKMIGKLASGFAIAALALIPGTRSGATPQTSSAAIVSPGDIGGLADTLSAGALENRMNEAIASTEGRSVAQVEARVAVFATLSKAMPKLRTDPTYAGVDPTGDLPVLLSTTGALPVSAIGLKVVVSAPLARSVGQEVTLSAKQVPHSWTELQQAATVAAGVGGVNAVLIDETNNRLVLKTATSITTDAALLSLSVPYSVVTEKTPLPASLQGGEHQSQGCTSGFAFEPNLVSTASHCPWASSQNRYSDGGSESLSDYNEYCYTETQLSSASGGSVGQVRANLIKGSGSFVNGEYVWKYGNVTNWTYGYAGGDVSYTIPAGYECAGTSYTLVQLTGGNISTIPGDSGGPIFAECGCGGFFARGMATNDASQAVPVTYITGTGFTIKTS
jgi:hypothetical protein